MSWLVVSYIGVFLYKSWLVVSFTGGVLAYVLTCSFVLRRCLYTKFDLFLKRDVFGWVAVCWLQQKYWRTWLSSPPTGSQCVCARAPARVRVCLCTYITRYDTYGHLVGRNYVYFEQKFMTLIHLSLSGSPRWHRATWTEWKPRRTGKKSSVASFLICLWRWITNLAKCWWEVWYTSICSSSSKDLKLRVPHFSCSFSYMGNADKHRN